MVSPKLGPVGAAPLARSRWARARWLVLAPHADDETLGAGALIRQAAGEGRLGGVVIVTDGGASHPHADDRARRRLVAIRRLEARRAIRLLTGRAKAQPIFLDWPDAAPPVVGDARFEATARRLAWLCRRLRIDALAVTAVSEPHCDHEAAGRLARRVVKLAGRPIALFEYGVWARPAAQGDLQLATRPLAAGRRALALAAHRSQRTPMMGPGFRLETPDRLSAACDRLYLRKAPHG